jgi:hypothetical protein
MISQLLEKIAALQTLLEQRTSLEGGTKGESFSIGDEVMTTGSLKVRDDASIYAGLMATQFSKARGTIIAGPKTKDGYTWWKIKYNNGVTGWSADNWLQATGEYKAPEEENDEDEEKYESEVSCDVKTNRSSYTRLDDIKVSWTSENANYLMFEIDPYKDGLVTESDKLDTSGSLILEATVLGLPSIKLKAVGDDGTYGYCSTQVKISEREEPFQAFLNGDEIKYINDVSKFEAQEMCKDLYNDYGTYNFDYGDVLECRWNGEEFETIDQWKG